MKIVVGSTVLPVASFPNEDIFFTQALALAIAAKQIAIEESNNKQWHVKLCTEDNLADIFSRYAGDTQKFGSYFDGLKELANSEMADPEKFIFNMVNIMQWFTGKYNQSSEKAEYRKALLSAVEAEKSTRQEKPSIDDILFELVLIQALTDEHAIISTLSTSWRLIVPDGDGKDLDPNFKQNIQAIRKWFDIKYNKDYQSQEHRDSLMKAIKTREKQIKPCKQLLLHSNQGRGQSKDDPFKQEKQARSSKCLIM